MHDSHIMSLFSPSQLLMKPRHRHASSIQTCPGEPLQFTLGFSHFYLVGFGPDHSYMAFLPQSSLSIHFPPCHTFIFSDHSHKHFCPSPHHLSPGNLLGSFICISLAAIFVQFLDTGPLHNLPLITS